MKKNIFNQTMTLLLILFGTSIYATAQQQVQYTQYMYNTMTVNPAYVGTSQKLEAHAIHRSQWVGIEGAPSTQNIGAQGRLNDKIGLGLNFIKDKIGPANNYYINSAVAVRLPLSPSMNLSVGLNAGIDMISVDWSMGQVQNTGDQYVNSNINNRVRPLIGAGAYVYGDNWYAGLSAPNVVQNRSNVSAAQNVESTTHFYLIGGYVFKLADKLKFKPAMMGKFVPSAPMTIDVSANFLINEKYTLGAAYRYNDAISLLAGISFLKEFFVGYSYDITLTKLRTYNSGSHDIMLRYTLFEKNQHAISPRFF